MLLLLLQTKKNTQRWTVWLGPKQTYAGNRFAQYSKETKDRGIHLKSGALALSGKVGKVLWQIQVEKLITRGKTESWQRHCDQRKKREDERAFEWDSQPSPRNIHTKVLQRWRRQSFICAQRGWRRQRWGFALVTAFETRPSCEWDREVSCDADVRDVQAYGRSCWWFDHPERIGRKLRRYQALGHWQQKGVRRPEVVHQA